VVDKEVIVEGISFTRDFERWMKGALGVERLSLSLSLSL
jgi:hypothetical protein